MGEMKKELVNQIVSGFAKDVLDVTLEEIRDTLRAEKLSEERELGYTETTQQVLVGCLFQDPWKTSKRVLAVVCGAVATALTVPNTQELLISLAPTEVAQWLPVAFVALSAGLAGWSKGCDKRPVRKS